MVRIELTTYSFIFTLIYKKCIYGRIRLYLNPQQGSPCQSFERLKRYGLNLYQAFNRYSGFTTKFP